MTILQARRYQPLDADLTAVAVSGLAGPWTAYTPTVTAFAGTLTTASGSGRYLTVGKLVFLHVDVTITTNGTGATGIVVTLPPPNARSTAIFVGREMNATGKQLVGFASATSFIIQNYDSSYPAGSGYRLQMSGVYEAT